MITRVEANQYRCFRATSQELSGFQILVGPNGSGKSVFLDIIAFLGTLVSEGVAEAVDQRSENFHDLVWGREGNCFELAIEAKIPQKGQARQPNFIRYEIGVRVDPRMDAIVLSKESLSFTESGGSARIPIISRDLRKVTFQSETSAETYQYELHTHNVALASLPLDESRFPASVWFRDLLREGVQGVVLDPEFLRAPSRPYQGKPRVIDGFNLGRLVAQLEEDPGRFKRWIAHLRTSLRDLSNVRSVLRPEDKTRYVMVKYDSGVEVPAWVVSDGTLRLLALTILAYLPDFTGTYLIEEPENGVHPTALETIYQSLSSIYDGQVLITSHSPILLNLPKLQELLCFQKTDEGTTIVRGDQHPALQEWKGSVTLGQLFAAGVLG
jgi:predicted ATPase